MVIGFLGFLVCIAHINFLKELSKFSHYFLQLSDIFLYFLDNCIGWLVGVGGGDDTELMPELDASIPQSRNDLADFFHKD
jgi:hypothetical protein